MFDIVGCSVWPFGFMAINACMCAAGPDGTILHRQPQKGLCVKEVRHHQPHAHTDRPWVYFLQVQRLLAFEIIKG